MSTAKNTGKAAVNSVLPPEIPKVIRRRHLSYALWFAVPFVVTLSLGLFVL